MQETSSGQPQVVVQAAPAQPDAPESMQQSAIAALGLASTIEELQRELNKSREDRLQAQREAYELQAKLADSEKKVEQLEAENVRIISAQTSGTHYHPSQERRSSQHQQVTPNSAPTTYNAPQYQSSSGPIYQSQPAPAQGLLQLCGI
jgi:hypothetical protein